MSELSNSIKHMPMREWKRCWRHALMSSTFYKGTLRSYCFELQSGPRREMPKVREDHSAPVAEKT